MKNVYELKPFDEEAEVIGSIIDLYIDNLASFVYAPLSRILKSVGIERSKKADWIPMKNLLSFYNTVLKEFGPNTVFEIGKLGPEALALLSKDNIAYLEILEGIDDLYQANHRNGYVGFYRVVEHKEEEKTVIMQVYTPYPRMFHKGGLTGFGRKYGSRIRIVDLYDHPEQSDSEYDVWFSITYH